MKIPSDALYQLNSQGQYVWYKVDYSGYKTNSKAVLVKRGMDVWVEDKNLTEADLERMLDDGIITPVYGKFWSILLGIMCFIVLFSMVISSYQGEIQQWLLH